MKNKIACKVCKKGFERNSEVVTKQVGTPFSISKLQFYHPDCAPFTPKCPICGKSVYKDATFYIMEFVIDDKLDYHGEFRYNVCFGCAVEVNFENEKILNRLGWKILKLECKDSDLQNSRQRQNSSQDSGFVKFLNKLFFGKDVK